MLVNLLNLQNKLMDVPQSDISKMLFFSTSNLVSFMFIKSLQFAWSYIVLFHKTSHTSCILFFFWFPRAGSRKSTPCIFRGKIVRGITTTSLLMFKLNSVHPTTISYISDPLDYGERTLHIFEALHHQERERYKK